MSLTGRVFLGEGWGCMEVELLVGAGPFGRGVELPLRGQDFLGEGGGPSGRGWDGLLRRGGFIPEESRRLGRGLVLLWGGGRPQWEEPFWEGQGQAYGLTCAVCLLVSPPGLWDSLL